MHEYDKSSKWLIQHHGNALLRVAGVEKVDWWRSVQAEVVQPRKLPDGLIEARLAGKDRESLFIAEISTYAEERVKQQVLEDLLMVFMDRKILPEAVILVLCRQGNVRVQSRLSLRSDLGWSSLRAVFRVIELWKVPAAELFELDDVGVVPLVPLSKFAEPPEDMLRVCRDHIEQNAHPDERANLLAVTQVLTRLRYKDRTFLDILGGSQAMIESPLIQEIEAKNRHDDIELVLKGRFGAVPHQLTTEIAEVLDKAHLRELVSFAATCKDLKSFRKKLKEERT